LPELRIEGGAPEPFYQAPKASKPAILFFREDFVRSLFHELAHYCLAGSVRRQLDDFGYWYSPSGRSVDQQYLFEQVEARPQGLEKLFCETWKIPFSPSLDDFLGRLPSDTFIENLEKGYIEMVNNPPETSRLVLEGMRHFISTHPTACTFIDRMPGIQ
jgi:elongation factor P hydroxylase